MCAYVWYKSRPLRARSRVADPHGASLGAGPMAAQPCSESSRAPCVHPPAERKLKTRHGLHLLDILPEPGAKQVADGRPVDSTPASKYAARHQCVCVQLNAVGCDLVYFCGASAAPMRAQVPF